MTLSMPSGVTLCSASCLVVTFSCVGILLPHYLCVDFHFFHLRLSATDVSAPFEDFPGQHLTGAGSPGSPRFVQFRPF